MDTMLSFPPPRVEKSRDLGRSPLVRRGARGESPIAAFTSSSFSSWVTSSRDLYWTTNNRKSHNVLPYNRSRLKSPAGGKCTVSVWIKSKKKHNRYYYDVAASVRWVMCIAKSTILSVFCDINYEIEVWLSGPQVAITVCNWYSFYHETTIIKLNAVYNKYNPYNSCSKASLQGL